MVRDGWTMEPRRLVRVRPRRVHWREVRRALVAARRMAKVRVCVAKKSPNETILWVVSCEVGSGLTEDEVRNGIEVVKDSA